MAATEYEDVAASQNGQALGDSRTGRAGDFLSHLIVIPATTSPGAVTLTDGDTDKVVFTGGATSVSNLVPFTIFLGCKSKNGPWLITTGADVSVRAVGHFT